MPSLSLFLRSSFIVFALSLWVIQHGHGQDISGTSNKALPPVALQIIKERESLVKRAIAEYDKAKADLFDKYATALEREVQKYRSAGDLETLLAVMREMESARKNRAITGVEVVALTSFRSTLQTMVGALERTKNLAVKEADNQCLRKLSEMRTTFTQAGNLEAAQAVDQQIKSLEGSGRFNLEIEKPSIGSGKSQDLLTEDKPIEGTVTLSPGDYTLPHRVLVGRREDVGGERKFFPGTLRVNQATTIQNSGIYVQTGELEAKGAIFRRLLLETEFYGTMSLHKSLFDQCIFAKGGSLVSEYFSTKWVMENCVFYGSFIRNWRVRHIGVQITNCTFHEVDFAQVEYVADAGDEVRREWLRIANCRFVNCKIPESLLIATNECVFENCTFEKPAIQIPIKRPIRNVVYLKPLQRIELMTPNVSLEVQEASTSNRNIGADLSYRLVDGRLEF